ncbi:MAG: hypothetical protein K8W52_05565 [Deltaproteobacteria bacterium]|nr:hypothetical protein [Deltaproteobacteria bacterium]
MGVDLGVGVDFNVGVVSDGDGDGTFDVDVARPETRIPRGGHIPSRRRARSTST